MSTCVEVGEGENVPVRHLDPVSAFPLFVVTIGIVIGIIALLRRSQQLGLVSAGLIMSYSTNSSVDYLFHETLGFGASWLLLAVLSLGMVLFFRVSLFRVMFIRNNYLEIILFCALLYLVIVSLVMSQTYVALRKLSTYLLVLILGFKIYGYAFVNSHKPVESLYYVIGILSVVSISFLCIALVTLVPQSIIDPTYINLIIGNWRLTRLEGFGIAHPVGMSISASLNTFVIMHWFVNSKRSGRKFLCVLLMVIMALVIILTGSRGAMIGLASTWLVIIWLQSLSRKDMVLYAIVYLVVVAFAVSGFWGYVETIFTRTSDKISLTEVAYSSRYHQVYEIYDHVGLGGFIVGMGAGASEIMSIELHQEFPLEPFWFRIILEWGMIGSFLYLITLAVLMRSVIRMETRLGQQGKKGIWILSSIYIFHFMTSPFYYGFSVFTGSLILPISGGVLAMHWIARDRAKLVNHN